VLESPVGDDTGVDSKMDTPQMNEIRSALLMNVPEMRRGEKPRKRGKRKGRKSGRITARKTGP
jgi:hypothetical protein